MVGNGSVAGPVALGIDVGTTNTKVVLVDAAGQVLGSAQRSVSSFRDGDLATQDAAELWDAVRGAIAAVTAEAPAAAAAVVAVGVCAQYSSIVPVAEDGTPSGPLVLYLDKRGTDPSWEVLGRHPEAFERWLDRHGIPPVGGGLSLGHLLHLHQHEPEVHAATSTYLEPMDYVILRLTGRVAATQCTMFMSQLIDNRTLGTTTYDPDLVAMAGIDPDRLPPLVRDGEAIGPLRAELAAELGIPAEAVVYTGINDSHAGAYATGAFRPGTVGMAIGTTGVLLAPVDRKDLDADHEILSMPSPHPDRYLVWAENGLAGKAMEHTLEHVVHATDALADHASDDAFARLDEALDSVAPGAGGVLFLPWLAGSLSPAVDAAMRGGFVGMSLDTHRADLVRAVAEGVAHNLRWLLPHVEAFSGQQASEVTFAGGAARSAAWARILADVLDRPVRVLADPDRAVARAAGLVALIRHGVLPGPDLGELVVAGPPLEPDARLRARYDAHHEQFLAAFSALRPICQALAQLPSVPTAATDVP